MFITICIPLLFPPQQALADEDEDDFIGISAPLYGLVDAMFQLQSRGFFRQGVSAIAQCVLPS